MFNIGGGELLIIFLVALIVLGPTKLPDAARQVGKVMGELRRLSAGFQSEMHQAMADPVGKAIKAAEAAEPTKTSKSDDAADSESAEDTGDAQSDSDDAPEIPDVTKTAPMPTVEELHGEVNADENDADESDGDESDAELDDDVEPEPPMFGDR